jgi:arylsulfatase A-like enzyme
VDLAPTLCEWAGLPRPKGFVGRSLAGALNGNPTAGPEAALSMLTKHGRRLRAVRTNEATLIVNEQTGATELYSRGDLAQKENLASTRPAEAMRLRELLAQWDAEAPGYRESLLSGRDNRIELDAEVRQDLRGLGYLN